MQPSSIMHAVLLRDAYARSPCNKECADSGDRDAQKKLDVVANEVLKTALAASNVVGVMASEVSWWPSSLVQARQPYILPTSPNPT
eukprot:1154067-Pelagomonas_calceolata.AAC.3